MDEPNEHDVDTPAVLVNGVPLKGHYKFESYPSAAGSKKQRRKRRTIWGEINKTEWYRKDAVWTKVSRMFSRSADVYHERIVDSASGDVRKEVVEPLSEHRGHGDAKVRSTAERDATPGPDG